MERHWMHVATAVVGSFAFTGALLFIRTRVRENRQRLIDEMAILFFKDADQSMVSFDYVRAKYEMATSAELAGQIQIRRPTTTLNLLVAAVPYSLLCAFGFLVVFLPLGMLEQDVLGYRMLSNSLFWSLGSVAGGDLREAAAVYAAAFLGGYIMTARVLLRAVQNYELSQLTFLQAAAHLAVGVLTGLLLFHLFGRVPPVDDYRAWAGLAFVCGYMPDFGLTSVFRRLRIKRLKQVDEAAVELSSIAPLEMLDGIDYDTRYRLEQSGFADVQNLAVANPLLIYVETPFSLYEAFDWVLQAQLCTAVGGAAFRKLKALGIRTSLDLERAVLADDAPDEVVLAVGAIVITSVRPEGGAAAPGGPFTPDGIRHLAMVMLDDLHVHRLRFLWTHIFEQITRPPRRLWLYRDRAGLSQPDGPGSLPVRPHDAGGDPTPGGGR